MTFHKAINLENNHLTQMKDHKDIIKKPSKIYSKKIFFHIKGKEFSNKLVHNLQIISIKNSKLKDFSIISKVYYLIPNLQIKITRLMI